MTLSPILLVALGLGGLGLRLLLPWRSGPIAWIGIGCLASAACGVAVHLAADPAVSSTFAAWGLGALGMAIVAASIAVAVAADVRVLAGGFVVVSVLTSLLVGLVAGWEIGFACLAVNVALVARGRERLAAHVPAGSADEGGTLGETHEATLVIVAATLLVAALAAWAVAPTDRTTLPPTAITVPSVGTDGEEIVVGDWSAEDRERVAANPAVVHVETGGETFPIRAPAAGILHIEAEAGTAVRVGDVIGRVEKHAFRTGLLVALAALVVVVIAFLGSMGDEENVETARAELGTGTEGA